MQLFLVRPTENGVTTYLQDECLTTEHVLAGLCLGSVRTFFTENSPLALQVIAPDELSVFDCAHLSELHDLMTWSWLLVFSARARGLALQLGCQPSDFFLCRIDADAPSEFFVHVPETLNDVIDFEWSTFDVEPTERSPVPFGLNQLAIKAGVRSKHLKPCWRPMMAPPDHMASELIAREDFVEAWTARGFTGASFRFIAECESEH